jgi:hypothetical protein
LPGTVTIIYNAQLANMDQHDMNVIKFKRDLSDVDIKKKISDGASLHNYLMQRSSFCVMQFQTTSMTI